MADQQNLGGNFPAASKGAGSGRAALMRRRLRRRIHEYALKRKRRNVTRRKVGSRKATVVLALILVLLFGAFAWAQQYLTPKPQGNEVSLNELVALAEEKRIVSATFLDEDNLVVGTYAAAAVAEEDEAAEDEQTKRGGAGDRRPGSGGDEKNRDGAGNKNDKKERARGGDSASDEPPSVAPEGEGTYYASTPSSDAAFGPLFDILRASGARVVSEPQTTKGVVRNVATYLLPLLILANFFGLLFTAGRGGSSGIGDVIAFGALGKKKQRRGFAAPVTFGDVGGAQEAVAELKEVVDYLRDPERYEDLGAVPPKGVLLFGPPGCGKTLLAKAVAGEAGVPFFSVAGAEFVESLVGVGAARVRDLFQRVRAVAPAIVFIDELDAAGRKRGAAGSSGGSDEREQTLNQLLVEMDGFEVSAGIVVVGATNRPDILDPALLRPGRFDRHITVDQPDAEGREEILELHARGKPVAPDVEFSYLARRTPGFSGADLANVINEAALLTVRQSKPVIHLPELEEAVQRVLHGPKRRGRVLSDDERRRAAFHESGHAVVAAAVGAAEEIHRVSILARGRGIGLTGIEREEERVLLTRNQLYEKIVTAMAGLAAEELVLGEPSTGAEEDLERATELAKDMIGRFGMSPRLGRVRLLSSDIEQFLGGDSGLNDLSAETHAEFDAEVRRLLEQGEEEALRVLTDHRSELDDLAARLLEQETLEGAPLYAILTQVSPSEVRFQAHEAPNGNGSRTARVARTEKA
ncbi:MAG TPA: ATP-dependent zinc metalloprotease FtsH [Actinomycetota bacterium]|nr:ATP-dependent zinc metalloprotease FtsH [Actinomycetota bacterium]